MSELLSRPEFISKMVRYRQGVVYGQWRIHEKAFLDIEQDILLPNNKNRIFPILSRQENRLTAPKEGCA